MATAHHLVERRDVAEHRIDAFEDDQLAGFGRQAPQALLERVDVIVAERDDLRIAQRAAVIDRRMAVDVEDDVVVLAGDGRNDAEVRLVAGREDHGMIHGVEVPERRLAFLVALIGAVEDAAAGRARAELVERLLAGGDDVRVEGHAHVIVGAEQDRALAVADGDGRRFHPLHDQVEGVGEPGRQQRLALLDQRVELGEEVAHQRFWISADRVGQLADILDLGLLVHGDDDVELVFDVGDEVEHRQAVPLEVLGKTRRLGDGDSLLVERFDEGQYLGQRLIAIGHGGVLVSGPRLSQSNGAQKRRVGTMDKQEPEIAESAAQPGRAPDARAPGIRTMNSPRKCTTS